MTHELIEAEIIKTLPIKRGKQEIVPIQQDDAEDVEHPGPGIDQRGTGKDEAGTGNQGKDNAEEQHLLLVLTRHLETGHNNQEHKQVINAQRFFSDVPGKVLTTHGGTAKGKHHNAEDHSQANIDGGPNGRFLQRRNMRLANMEEVVKGQKGQNNHNGNAPNQGGNSHDSVFR